MQLHPRQVIDTKRNNVPFHGGYSTTDFYNAARLMPAGTIIDPFGLPQNANSYTTSIGETLQPDSIEKLMNSFAPLATCSRVFDPDPYQPYITNHIKYCTAGTTTLTETTGSPITDFQADTTNTFSDVQVSITHYCQPWHITNAQFNSGARLEDALAENLLALANTVTGVWCSNFTTANYSQTVTSAPDAFTLSDAASAFAKLKKGANKALILDGEYYSKMSHTAGFNGGVNFGWRNGIWEQSGGWSSAGTKVRGFALAPQALVAVTGVLVPLRTQTVSQKLITLGQTGLIIEFNKWLDTKTRTQWASLDLVFGTGKADTAQGVCIVEP